MARIACALILLLEARGLFLSIRRHRGKTLVFYTQISNIVTAVSALLLLVFGQPQWVTVLRYLSACMLVMTFLVTICILIPMGGDSHALLWSGNGLYHHVLCPILSTLSYILLEQHSGAVWLPVAVTLVYGLVLLYLNGIRRVDGPYPFFRVHQQSAAASVLWVAVLLAAITAISAGVWALAGLVR